MSFNNFTSSVKLNKIQTYNNVNNNANAVFKNTFYDDIEEINYNEYADINYDSINLNESIQKAIENGAIEEEKNFLENAWDFYKSYKATCANMVIGFSEGLFSFGETIVDTAIMLGGAAISIHTLKADLLNGIITGDWDFSVTGTLWKNKIMPTVGFDATDFVYDAAYDTVFSGIEENAFGFAKREGGTLYSVSKGVGYYTGVIAASTLTCGVGGIASGTTSSAFVQGGMMAASKFGQTAQSGYNTVAAQAENEGREVTDGEIFKTLGVSFLTGAVEGGVMAAAGSVKISNKIVKDAVGAGIKATKSFASEAVNWIATGEEYNLKEAGIGALTTLVAEGAGMGFKGVTGAYTPAASSPSVVSGPTKSPINTGATQEVAKTVEEKVWKNILTKTVETSATKAGEKATKDLTSKVAVPAVTDAIRENKIDMVKILGEAATKTVTAA